MKLIRILLLLGAFSLRCASADELDAGIAKLSSLIAKGVNKAGAKKVSVVDFTDLQGQTNDLGRFVAEQLSVVLVNSGEGFSVVDRGRMKIILDELKLNATGLINPEAMKNLGKVSGADIIIIGTFTAFDDTVALTAKAIATETTDVIGAASSTIVRSKNVNTLLSKGAPGGSPSGPSSAAVAKPDAAAPKDPYVKHGEGLKLTLERLQHTDGTSRSVRFLIENISQKELAIAVQERQGGLGAFASSNGELLVSYADGLSGLPVILQNTRFTSDALAKIKPGEKIRFSVNFRGYNDTRQQRQTYSIELTFAVLGAGASSVISEIFAFDDVQPR